MSAETVGTTDPRVAVQAVSFHSVQQNNGRETGLQAEVIVEVDAVGSGRTRFADRVNVVLTLGTEVGEAVGGFEFYRTEATAVSLESGRARFCFYLPPEIVRRDRLQPAAIRYWVVDLSVGGREVPVSRAATGTGFTSVAALDNFRRQAAQRAAANDGVLLPWYLTPLGAVEDASPLPSVVRRP